MKNGATVAAFERAFADYVGADYAIAMVNGTATLHSALVALGVKPGDKVATTPLTMSATSIAILQAGAVPVYQDVKRGTWLIDSTPDDLPVLAVSLYGLHFPSPPYPLQVIDDAAQTLRKHNSTSVFTSYSFQASKILSLGEGGCLVTDSEELATKAREFSSLGYRMKADQPRIDPSVLKSPNYERHHTFPSANYRMNDLTAAEGLRWLDTGWLKYNAAELALQERREAASYYRQAIEGCSWITPQYIPEGWQHDMWSYAIALESPELWNPFVSSIERHGGERPYAAWLPSYLEPALRQYGRPGLCPIAEGLQKRIVAFQTNDLASAERNAKAVRLAIEEIDERRWRGAGRPGKEYMEQFRRKPSADATGTPCS